MVDTEPSSVVEDHLEAVVDLYEWEGVAAVDRYVAGVRKAVIGTLEYMSPLSLAENVD
jgi:hypothetical protein